MSLRRVLNFFAAFGAMLAVSAPAAASLKILCLHGGGQSSSAFQSTAGMRALEASFPQITFVYASGGFPGDLWVPDPPGGKGQPTTVPNVAAASMAALDTIVANQGPFFGILGYSQGSMFVAAYLSHAPANTFQVAMMFAGYTPETHQGLLASIESAAPFGDIPALVWMGTADSVISNVQTNGQAALFTNPTVLVSQGGDHAVPSSVDSTYAQVVEYVTFHSAASSPTAPTAPVESPTLSPSPGASPTPSPTKSGSSIPAIAFSSILFCMLIAVTLSAFS